MGNTRVTDSRLHAPDASTVLSGPLLEQVKQTVAELNGIPRRFADRLQGNTLAELANDTVNLLDALEKSGEITHHEAVKAYTGRELPSYLRPKQTELDKQIASIKAEIHNLSARNSDDPARGKWLGKMRDDLARLEAKRDAEKPDESDDPGLEVDDGDDY